MEIKKVESHRNSGTVCRWVLHKAKNHNCARNFSHRSLSTQGSSRVWPSSVSMITQLPLLYNTSISPNCTFIYFLNSFHFHAISADSNSQSPHGLPCYSCSFLSALSPQTDWTLPPYFSDDTKREKSLWLLLVPTLFVYKELSTLGYSVTLVREGHRQGSGTDQECVYRDFEEVVASDQVNPCLGGACSWAKYASTDPNILQKEKLFFALDI